MSLDNTAPERVRVNGVELHVLQEGPAAAPAVVFSNAILTDVRLWDEQAKLLGGRFRVIRYDTRGHGRSSVPAGPYTMADLVADARGLLDALEIDRAHFVGLSLGGMTGLGMALAYPERLLSLAACDMRADAPPDVARPWDDRIASARSSGVAALTEATIARWFGRPFIEGNAARLAPVRSAIAATPLEGFVGCARALQRLDYLDAVPTLRVPTTFVVGENDGVLPDVMDALRARVSGARLEVIPAAGHLPNIENAARFNAVLLRHLDAHGARRST